MSRPGNVHHDTTGPASGIDGSGLESTVREAVLEALPRVIDAAMVERALVRTAAEMGITPDEMTARITARLRGCA